MKNKRPTRGNRIPLCMSLGSFALLAACGGGGGGSSGSAATSSTQLSGKAIDGYLSGATVCFDNGQGACDTSLPSTTTDANGNYTLNVSGSVTGKQLDAQVSSLRDTISTVENGQRTTLPFDVALSHQLYSELFGPFAAEMPSIKHLIFEPDGAMLRLPANLLVMDQVSVDAYRQRASASDDAAYDFRGVNWLGRDRDISTSVSPRSFAQLRAAPPSAGRKEYLGLGQNTPPTASAQGLIPAAADRDCILPLSSWAPSSSTSSSTGRLGLPRAHRF